MAPVDAHALAAPGRGNKEIEEWSNEVEEVTSQIRGIIDGTITDFEAFDQQLALKERAKQIRQEESQARRQKFLLNGSEGKGEGTKYKWWCKRCFVEYLIDLPEGKCTRCQQSDKLMSQEARREELMGKLEVFKEEKAKHKWRKDKWGRWKKSQALLGKSRFINYKAWEYWEPDTDSEEEGDPIVPRDNPEFLAMEADLKERKRKQSEKNLTAERCRQRGNQCMKEGDYVGAIENYEEGLEYRRDCKALWTNKALAEVKVFRWHDAIGSCNKVIEYAEIFEEGFAKSADACFKAFTRRATALRGLHKWEDALNDLEDALTIFPKNKEAQDLLEKTKLACQEPRNETCEEEEVDGPVRVEIEESDESEAEGPEAEIDAPPDSLGQLSKSEFGQLLKSLESAAERSVFCARPGEFSGQTKPKADQWVGRKIDLKVDEVAQPSRLDGVLKDIERSCILWKKRRPNADGRRAMQDDEPESKDADAFVELVVPRALSVLLALADNDHHCSLTVPALRHVWPMLLVEDWRYQILSLLHEWSSRSITVRSMAEFASRYPEHVQLLIDIVASERKEDALPPGFEDSAKKMADKLGLGADLAVAEVRKALLRKSPVELAILGLGNLCSQGASLSHFKDQISGYVAPMVAALRRHLRPMDWRCGAAAGALCNLLRLGKAAAEEVEKCSELLLTALREEAKPEVMASLKAMQGADCGVQLATSRLLGALVNLVVVQPGALVGLQQMGALEVAAGLIDPEAYSPSASSSAPESEALVVSTRACLLSAKLVATSPDLSAELETGILRHVQQILEKVTFSTESLETVDPPVRLLVTLVTKIPGAVDRFLSSSFPLAKLSELLQALLPGTHLAPEDEAGTASRLRGNLSLLFGVLSEQQAAGAVPDLDLSPEVAIFVEMLRRERGAAQHNLGVCVTKLAQNPRYRDQVRELNGLESLHQIQLPKVNAQKEKERKMHRLETSAEDRRREILRRRA